MTENNRRGLLIILSSPSGAGKSTLSRMLLDWDSNLQFSISATTRGPRSGEQDGREYYFKTREGFEAMVASGDMLEHAEVFGNFYGSPREPVEDAVSIGKDVVFDVDWQGGQQIGESTMSGDVVSIFILPPSIAELERRLNSRGQDSAEVVANRMSKSKDEISHWREYEYLIVNDDLEASFETLKSILIAERTKRVRRNDLMEHVNNLNAEFEALS
ncbi:guanylate kinase [Amylibacter sp. SFDW26]|uniref:guanylate kinase n=1 Tax=Amylibacter sp. SFDW26 TaxID=2652722 RepID=UPI001261E38D|nr:guanylate kinase [Amylibacter sp. SFDW26]KAB7610254.1 guanylate kinase [Amylibacter sp. SFDW26]